MGSYGHVNGNAWGLCGGMFQWSTWDSSYWTGLPCYSRNRTRDITLDSSGCTTHTNGADGIYIGGNHNNSQVVHGTTAWAFHNWYPGNKLYSM